MRNEQKYTSLIENTRLLIAVAYVCHLNRSLTSYRFTTSLNFCFFFFISSADLLTPSVKFKILITQFSRYINNIGVILFGSPSTLSWG